MRVSKAELVTKQGRIWRKCFPVTLRCTTPRPDVAEMGLCESTSKNTENGIKYLITVPERKIGAMALRRAFANSHEVDHDDERKPDSSGN